MTAVRPRHPGQRTPRRQRYRTTRLHLEQLEDRLTPSLTGGAVPGQLLMRFQPGVTQAEVADLYADHHLSELRNLDLGPDKEVRLVATPTPQAELLIPELQQDP